jgi:hypothetical protein
LERGGDFPLLIFLLISLYGEIFYPTAFVIKVNHNNRFEKVGNFENRKHRYRRPGGKAGKDKRERNKIRGVNCDIGYGSITADYHLHTRPNTGKHKKKKIGN